MILCSRDGMRVVVRPTAAGKATGSASGMRLIMLDDLMPNPLNRADAFDHQEPVEKEFAESYRPRLRCRYSDARYAVVVGFEAKTAGSAIIRVLPYCDDLRLAVRIRAGRHEQIDDERVVEAALDMIDRNTAR